MQYLFNILKIVSTLNHDGMSGNKEGRGLECSSLHHSESLPIVYFSPSFGSFSKLIFLLLTLAPFCSVQHKEGFFVRKADQHNPDPLYIIFKFLLD